MATPYSAIVIYIYRDPWKDQSVYLDVQRAIKIPIKCALETMPTFSEKKSSNN